jgi:hypothetical protein
LKVAVAFIDGSEGVSEILMAYLFSNAVISSDYVASSDKMIDG